MKLINKILTLLDFIIPPLAFFLVVMAVPGNTTNAQSFLYDSIFKSVVFFCVIILLVGIVFLVLELKNIVTKKLFFAHILFLLVAIFVLGGSIYKGFLDFELIEKSSEIQVEAVDCEKIKPNTVIKDSDSSYELNIDKNRFDVQGCYLMPKHFTDSIKNDQHYYVVLEDKILKTYVAFDEFLLIGQNVEYDNYIKLSNSEEAKKVFQNISNFVFASQSGFILDSEDTTVIVDKYDIRYLGNGNKSERVNIFL